MRRSVWERDADVDRAGQADDLRVYVASGPQIADRFLFTNRIRHPRVAEVTDAAFSTLARGVSVESVLSTWLPTVEDLAAGDGLAPDGPLRITIDRSVPVNAPSGVEGRRPTDPPEAV